MTDPTHDDERALRAALGTLLADEPPPVSTVADDVARGRAYRSRRRARAGGGIALLAVVALVVGLVGPLRALDRSTPAPLGSASPSPSMTGSQTAVADYLASLGWQVSGTSVTIVPENGAVDAAAYAVHSTATPPRTALLTVQAYGTPPASDFVEPESSGSRFGTALQRCGSACSQVSSMAASCIAGSAVCLTSEVSSTVSSATADFAAGTLIVDRVWSDGTQLEAVATPPSCSSSRSASPTPCASATDAGASGSFLSTFAVGRVLDLTGKPALLAQPTPNQTTFTAGPGPNPYFVIHAADPAWVSEQLTALTTAVAARGVTVSGRDNRNAILSIERGKLIASLWLIYASTTTDSPECLGLTNCTVLQPWTTARGGAAEIAVTKTIPPNTNSSAFRGPSYQVLVRSGHRLVRLNEGTSFGSYAPGQTPGFVLTWQEAAALADLLTFPGASITPSASPS